MRATTCSDGIELIHHPAQARLTIQELPADLAEPREGTEAGHAWPSRDQKSPGKQPYGKFCPQMRASTSPVPAPVPAGPWNLCTRPNSCAGAASDSSGLFLRDMLTTRLPRSRRWR